MKNKQIKLVFFDKVLNDLNFFIDRTIQYIDNGGQFTVVEWNSRLASEYFESAPEDIKLIYKNPKNRIRI